jgi:hypothetical protein
MTGVIVARRGERIVLAEYPKGFAERVNARLDAIAAEGDDETTEVCS